MVVVQGQNAATSNIVHDEPLPALLAARLSSMKKGKFQGINIETQDEEAREWAGAQAGFQTAYGTYPGIQIIDVAADIKTGRVAPWDRKNLKPWVTRPDMMQRYGAIIAHKNDRLSRGDPADEWRIRQWAEDNGKALIIVNGPQWPPRHDGDFWLWTAMAKNAATEWHEGRERSMRAQRALRGRGVLAGGSPPWGYVVVGEEYAKTLMPTDECRQWAPLIFEAITEGQTLRQVCGWLNAKGIPSKQGKQWSPRSLQSMIRNRTYTGMRTSVTDVPLFPVEAVIPADLWLRANDRLRNAPAPRRGPSTSESALLTGSLFCDMCPRDGKHAPMYRTSKTEKTGETYTYYRCAGHYPENKGCGFMVDLAATDEAAIVILSTSEEPRTELELVKGVNHAEELAQVRLAIRDLATLELSDEEHDRRLKELRKRRDELKDMENIPDRWEPVDTGLTVGKYFISLDHEGQRQMIRDEVKFYAQPGPRPDRHQGRGRPRRVGAPILSMESRLFLLPPAQWEGPAREIA